MTIIRGSLLRLLLHLDIKPTLPFETGLTRKSCILPVSRGAGETTEQCWPFGEPHSKAVSPVADHEMEEMGRQVSEKSDR